MTLFNFVNLVWVLTLDFLLRFTFRKLNFSFFMSSHRIIKNLTSRKRCLLKRTNSKRLVMRFYENCNRLKKKCRVSTKFDRYIKCIRLDRKCDLTFFVVKWKRVKTERDRVLSKLLTVYKQMQKIIAKATRLQSQFEFLKNKK